jgi:hypothetical protein
VEASPSVADLIREAATGARRLTPDELRRVLGHIAQAGFDPNGQERARGRLAGIPWQGRIIEGSDALPPADAHYLRHVIVKQEWPDGTTLAGYIASIREVILDPRSGVLTCRYQGALQITVVRQSGTLRGLLGFEWILVDYRVATDHWMTAFQPEEGLQELRSPRREDMRWLRRPRSLRESKGASTP